MTKDQEITLALSKVVSIGRAQARYSLAAIGSALLGYIGTQVAALSFVVELAPIGIALSIIAWFGVARAAGHISAKLKDLIPDYNYALYGGAPPFIWALAYSKHNGGGLQRILALASFPVAFTALLVYGAFLVMPESPFTIYTLVYAAPIYQVAGLWKNRIKAMVK